MIKSIVTFALFWLVLWLIGSDTPGYRHDIGFILALFATAITATADFFAACIEGYRNAPNRSERL